MATKADILETKADIAELKSELIRWVAGIGFATVTTIVAVLAFLFSRLDASRAPAPPPIVINVPAPSAPR